jgi:hypothetical protein
MQKQLETKPLTNEAVGILCSELLLQLDYIKESGNKYRNIDLARELVNRLNLSIPKESRLR